MRSAIAFSFVAAVVLASCQPIAERPDFDVPTSRAYEQGREAVWQDVLAFLDEAGITVVQEDFERGWLLATRQDFEDAGWAWCERAMVVDRSSESRRPTRARPAGRDLALEIQMRALEGGSEVLLAAEFTEEQINPYRNLPLTQDCLSTGVLERELLAAVES